MTLRQNTHEEAFLCGSSYNTTYHSQGEGRFIWELLKDNKPNSTHFGLSTTHGAPPPPPPLPHAHARTYNTHTRTTTGSLGSLARSLVQSKNKKDRNREDSVGHGDKGGLGDESQI